MTRMIPLVTPLLLAGMAWPACAEEAELQQDWQLSGFYSVALTDQRGPLTFYPTLSQFGADYGSTPSYKPDSTLGMQLDGSLGSQLSVSSQLVVRDQADYRKGDAVERLFVRYQPDDRLTLRAGRLAMDTFMLSDYRRVAYAYPWVRPPQDFYGYLSLDHFDGVDVSYRWQAAGEWQAKLNVGPSRAVLPVATPDYRLRTSEQWGGVLQWQHDALTLRAGYTTFLLASQVDLPPVLATGLQSLAPFWPEAGNVHHKLQLSGKRLTYKTLGGAYDRGDLWVRGELATLRNQSLWFPGVDSYYLAAGWRQGDWQPYASYGQAKAARPPLTLTEPAWLPGASPLARGVEQAVNAIAVNQRTVSLGLRWEMQTGMALKLQWDQLRTRQGGNGLLGGGNVTEPRPVRKHIVSLAWQGVF